VRARQDRRARISRGRREGAHHREGGMAFPEFLIAEVRKPRSYRQ